MKTSLPFLLALTEEKRRFGYESWLCITRPKSGNKCKQKTKLRHTFERLEINVCMSELCRNSCNADQIKCHSSSSGEIHIKWKDCLSSLEYFFYTKFFFPHFKIKIIPFLTWVHLDHWCHLNDVHLRTVLRKSSTWGVWWFIQTHKDPF